jgi:ABC-type multidrug transport system ATPase subunit
MLEIDNLTVTYRKGSEALKEVSMKLEAGKAVVVGPNGSGKTTLLKAALGLAPITRGRVRVFGTDVEKIRGDTRVSTNIPEVYRLARLPVKRVVSLYAELKGAGPAEPLKMIDDFELCGALNKWMYELSSGQQKLLGDILALSFEPKLCLLDEPFDQVDQD